MCLLCCILKYVLFVLFMCTAYQRLARAFFFGLNKERPFFAEKRFATFTQIQRAKLEVSAKHLYPHDNLKIYWHKIFHLWYFHQKNPPGPLIQIYIKNIYIYIRICMRDLKIILRIICLSLLDPVRRNWFRISRS